MKKILLTSMLLFGFSFLGNSQTINFPDSNFKGILLNANTSNSIATNSSHNPIVIDTNGDGEIQISEALQVHQLRIMEANISDLTGIEYFTNLDNLNCSYNQLTNLNIINTIPNLVTLSCNNNQLTSLDISSLNTLEQLRCNNNAITSANLTLNSNLTLLDCSNNPLGNLNTSILTNLKILLCKSNSLSNLDVTNLTDLHTLDCSINSLTSLNVSTLTDLIRLNLSGNPVNTIDLSALIILEYLTCSQNGLTSLNVSSSPNLIELSCHINEISSLDVSVLTNLEKLQINNNLLTTIDLTGLNNLEHLVCSYNLFTDLDVSPLTNLEHLNYGNEGIGNIDVQNLVNLKSFFALYIDELPTNTSNLQNLQSVTISMSEIEEIDMSNLSSLNGFNSITNNTLTYANLKNGNDFTVEGISFSGNPNLMFVCVNDNDLNNVYDLNSNGDFFVSSYCTFEPGGNYNIIKGSVLMNCNEDDFTVYTKVTIYDGTEEGQGASFTDENGEYKFFTQSGTYIITPDIENPDFFTLTPPINAAIFQNNNNNVETIDFCIAPNGTHNDLEIIIAPIDPARPGFDAKYKLVYRNKGNQIVEGNINFKYDQTVLDLVSTSVVPTLSFPEQGDLMWTIPNIHPFESGSIEVVLNVNSPQETPSVNIGDILPFEAFIDIITDENWNDNEFVFNQTVVGAYDPNDITCIEGDVVTPNYIGEELHYVIRFENTGNFYAENVVIAMEVNQEKYDISSLKVLNSSHDVRAQVKNGKVEFFFNGILLDSGGHGNILFAVKSSNNLQVGDSVQSKADIYFDYNYPIITNDAITTFETTMSMEENIKNIDLKFYPNPTTDYFNITSQAMIKSVELYDVSGRLVRTSLVNDFESKQNVSNLNNGIYILKIKTNQGEVTGKIVKK